MVRTNIDWDGGTIDVKSVSGEGSVTIKIPLTLAIVSALIVEAAGDRRDLNCPWSNWCAALT